jgi:RNA polymerase sigma-70 factor (ECF subfamily)
MSNPETSLVLRARGGDAAAFEELVRRTSRLVYARLLLETGDAHRAEDLLQETLVRAYRSISQLDDVETFRAWLLTIAQNVLLDAARREARLKRAVPPRSAMPLSFLPSSAPPPEKAAEQSELRGQILAVLRSLPEEYRDPLTLRYLVGADYETISRQLGLSNGALRGLLHRGLKLLRERLPPEFGDLG